MSWRSHGMAHVPDVGALYNAPTHTRDSFMVSGLYPVSCILYNIPVEAVEPV